jgi:energy-coupling factor transporter ATP-binding protein EcfA2
VRTACVLRCAPASKTLFRGRERTVAQVEQLLTDANNHAMALIGPRRCGKSSLLNMLPVLLPDSIIVQFDLQDNPADTPMRFYQGLAKVTQSQARRSHNLELPGLYDTGASPIEALKQWFEQLENFTPVPRILLCIDEFEKDLV